MKSISETIESLKVIRAALCSYHSQYGKLCDCKFGVHLLPGKKWPTLPTGENGCGCPELYTAIAYLEDLEKISKS